MKKTLLELINMYEAGQLRTEHSTQRNFIYNDLYVERDDGEISKAGDVVKSILQEGVQLPALYFWSVQDDKNNIHYADNEYNIHDGKQRFLSLYYFVKGEVTTRLRNPSTGISRETGYAGLTDEQQQTLLNYEFDIVVRKGTQAQEERSFYLINSTGEILKSYESLRGAYHGEYFYTFEDYITKMSKVMTRITAIGRGEQAIWLLLLAANTFTGNKDDKNREKLINNLSTYLDLVRNTTFDPTKYDFDKKLELYNDLSLILAKNKDKNPIKVCRIVKYVIERGYDPEIVKAYYKKIMAVANDVDAWKFGTHKTALDKLCLEGIECDGLRFFTKADKNELIRRNNNVCACCDCGEILNFEDATIDHIKPWSLGGRTTLDNGRIMCAKCNSSKGAKEVDTDNEEGLY